MGKVVGDEIWLGGRILLIGFNGAAFEIDKKLRNA